MSLFNSSQLTGLSLEDKIVLNFFLKLTEKLVEEQSDTATLSFNIPIEDHIYKLSFDVVVLDAEEISIN